MIKFAYLINPTLTSKLKPRISRAELEALFEASIPDFTLEQREALLLLMYAEEKNVDSF
jgi:hypothetical protein